MSASEKNKLSIICFSGDFDNLVAAFTLAIGSAALNYNVTNFFTFWGLYVIEKKKERSFSDKGILARTFNTSNRRLSQSFTY